MDALEKLQSALTGRYAVVREVGAGGMATVFLARDVKHDRHVALKVLRPELGAVLGVERFLSEIKVTAHLQHPHLLPLFDSGEAEGLLFYVMPFVEGQSLRTRLDEQQQLPIEEALRITLAVASALDYAHKQGVIHRDLKPENILLQHGEPVVSDFGIALAVSNAGGARVTQTGLSLGTPQYMSPEQATGDRVVDARSDIYSLGAVLYEMLTGEPPHAGKTAQAIIARVLTEKTNSTRVTRDTVPEHVDAAVLKALAKLPADRFASAAEFAAALKNPSWMTAAGGGPGGRGAASGSAGGGEATGAGANRSQPNRARRALPWLIAAIGAGFGLASWLGFGSRPSGAGEADSVVRFTISLPPSVGFGSTNSALAISPDGSAIVVGSLVQRGLGLFIRTLDDPQLVPLAGTAGAGAFAAFSPDGAWIAFIKGTTLLKIPRGGGPVVTMAEGIGSGAGLAWGDGDRIVFGKGGNSSLSRGSGGLWIISAAGGDARQLTKVDSATELGHGTPSFLPGGRAVVFAIQRNAGGAGPLAIATLDGKVTLRASTRYTVRDDRSHLLFFDLNGTVMSAPFDAPFVESPVPRPHSFRAFRFAMDGRIWAISRNGTFGTTWVRSPPTLVSVDRSGVATPLFADARGFRRPRVSPDGRRVVVEVGQGGTAGSGSQVDLWMLDRTSGTMSRFTFGPPSSDPLWSPDGKRVAYARAGHNQLRVSGRTCSGSRRMAPSREPLRKPGSHAMATDSPHGNDYAGVQQTLYARHSVPSIR